ncbi:DNA polymerase I [Gammaproteobacteria bacterium LSUCC0112]|nr:DNA polymerase I [Gammaproteobacteria bacterium LSUCC0112]
MTPNALPYTAVWALDFEFIARDGEHPEVVCLVAHDLISSQWLRIWQDGFTTPPFPLTADTLFVGYSAAAEWSCFIALGWPMPPRCIDLFAEFTRVTNGAFDSKMFPSLLAAASHFGITTTDADHKGAMRDLILSGGPWDDAQRRGILNYCTADVRMTADLFRAMWPVVCRDPATLGGALLRGRYTCAVARMEWNGTPIDVATLARLNNSWDDIKLDLIADIDQHYGVFDGTKFDSIRFTTYIEHAGIPWPRLPSGALMLDDDTFRERAKSYPAIAPLRELRHALGKMRDNSLAVGQDGRNRTGLMPFGSKTGRNQPSNSRFIFGASRWLRSLIQPPPGRALAYVDWSSQEIAIAAALSGDDTLWEAYNSGDPYMTFAKQAGLAPEHATKATHKGERQRAKAIVLGVGYGMSAESMAVQAGLHLDEARDLLLRHKLTYPQFWAWATQNQNAGLLGLTLQTTYGWTWQAGFGTTVNPRSLLNWPMQANGAEMMRLACCELIEQGIMVCCPVHDALLVEGDAADIDNLIATTRVAMERASELVLGAGRIVRTDVDVVHYPDRYADEAGVGMWDRVMAHLDARGL